MINVFQLKRYHKIEHMKIEANIIWLVWLSIYVKAQIMYSLGFTFFCLFLVIWCVFSSHQEDDPAPSMLQWYTYLIKAVSLVWSRTFPIPKFFSTKGIRYGLYMDEFYSLLKFSHVLGRVITRFSRPLPERNWASLIDGKIHVLSECYQMSNYLTFCVKPRFKAEDCLYLSIWSPVQTNSKVDQWWCGFMVVDSKVTLSSHFSTIALSLWHR